MEDSNEKIIVFKAYDTVMEANLAKTKLDAYGIPCFLTDENFVGLYPIRNEVFPGVRLHIFERDADIVKDTLAEISMERSCPYCRSLNVVRELTDEDKPMRFLAALTSGILFPDQMVFKCQDCQREFENPDYR